MSIRWRNTLLVIALMMIFMGFAVFIALRGSASATCPSDWSSAQRVPVVDGRHGLGADGPGTIGIVALLDYMPRATTFPIGRSNSAHPLVALVTVSSNEEELQRTTVECIRITHGDDVWLRKPQLQAIQTSTSSGAAWRQAIAEDGPEWPVEDQIRAEAWVTFGGRQYIFDFGSFVLRKGL